MRSLVALRRPQDTTLRYIDLLLHPHQVRPAMRNRYTHRAPSTQLYRSCARHLLAAELAQYRQNNCQVFLLFR